MPRKKLTIPKLKKKACRIFAKSGENVTRRMSLKPGRRNKDGMNGMWKGNEVGKKALHRYIEKRLPRPYWCPCCGERPTYDLANKGIYNRELKNWEWLCRHCHMVKDGRMKNLKQWCGKKAKDGLPFSKAKQLNIVNKKPTVKQLDDLTRQIVRLRDKKCIRCGNDNCKLEAAHCFSRAKFGTRWDLDNVHLHCFNCHYNFLHKDPIGAGRYWLKLFGERKYILLEYRSKGSKKDLDMAGIKVYLKQELKKYEEKKNERTS